VAIEDVISLAKGIMTHNGGQPTKRETLLKKMGLEANAQSTRNLIMNSAKYGLTEGSHSADMLTLTAKGRAAVDLKAQPRDRKQALFDVAIRDDAEFNALYEKRRGSSMPAPEMLNDDLVNVDPGDRKACADAFVSNEHRTAS